MNIRSKLAIGITIPTVMLSAPFRQAWPVLVWLLSALPLIWMLFLKRWRMAGIYILVMFLSHIERIPALEPLSLHLPWPILLFLTILQLCTPGIAVGILILQTTSISEYINGLSRMRIPAGITLATSVIFRFFPTIRAENIGIKRALRMRRLTGLKALHHPLKFFNYRLTPLLLSTSGIGDELSMASLCRGLSTERKRTSYESDNLRFYDWIIIVLSGLLILLWLVTLLVAPRK
ncbi:MAG: energy-coupling factor transporter transmembrane protein EcfT [Clostridiaceae bacterium]|jgi:energy-coupling factor transporter transmembrane protein EcfT|nr:energy-coupling factor transporter transmembrane protein EcfT [Clostridiaceae bacterium]